MRRDGTKVYSLNKILVGLIAVIIIIFVGVYGSYRIQASRALREAKNLALSMELLNVYGSAEGYEIYDSSRPNGLSERAEKELKDLARAEGEVVLTRWDRSKGRPAEFTYTYKQSIVEYHLNKDGKPKWKASYKLPII